MTTLCPYLNHTFISLETLSLAVVWDQMPLAWSHPVFTLPWCSVSHIAWADVSIWCVILREWYEQKEDILFRIMQCGGSVVVGTHVTIVHAWLLCHCRISLVGTVHCLLALISCFHYISILAGLLVSEPQHRIQCINISCLNHHRVRAICINYTSDTIFIYFKRRVKTNI